MADKNFKSYEALVDTYFAGVTLRPDDPKGWDDTMKVWHCRETTFQFFDVLGSTEDCLDVGSETSDCGFLDFKAEPTGQYVVTCKGGSNNNAFVDWLIKGHGRDVDFEFGNWSTYNFERSTGNRIVRARMLDGSPVTYSYRLGCKPSIVDTKAKHLWLRSVGLTAFWYAKYFWHVILKQPDHMGK